MKVGKIAAIAFMVFLLVGCEERKPVQPPETKANPTPREQYEIVLTLKEDIGAPVRAVNGFVAHKISNRECVPVDSTRSLGGSTPIFFEDIDINFKEVAARTYSGTLYRDQLIDEDYYGLGACKWHVDAMTIKVNIDGRPYTVGLSGIEIAQEGSGKKYCLRPDAAKYQGSVSCVYEAAMALSKLDRSNFFEVNLTSKRIQ